MGLKQTFETCDAYVYNSFGKSKAAGFLQDTTDLRQIANLQWKGLLLYSPLPFFSCRYNTLVLMLHKGHLTTWLLLLTKWLHRKKIILWGHGISIPRYLKEEQHPNPWNRRMLRLADAAWFYMEKEKDLWQQLFPDKPMVALGNTLSGIEEMLRYKPTASIGELKEKYHIRQDIVFIFCARFSSAHRRTDLLEEVIRRLPSEKYGFIIIGNGPLKPDFSIYNNVYDFGAVYDTTLKQELFTIADAYFQPGWVGLSIVEAMAYGLPILTFKRSQDVVQCVEYSYIQDDQNGMIFNEVTDCCERIITTSKKAFHELGQNARNTASQTSPQKMVKKACSVL